MPINPAVLLADCRRQVIALEADLQRQAAVLPELDASLRAEYKAGRDAGRIGDAYEIWLGEQATQGAVHWVLGGVFVRFLEDNGLLATPLLAGPGERNREAEDNAAAFFHANPLLHERDWLLHTFRAVGALPGAAGLFDETHNPAFRWPPSPDAAKALVQFWRRVDPDTGAIAHDFTDSAWDTRFLGDLYQHLSKSARKKYALLQTPIFVEEFILDRTLDPALGALPLEKVTVIDPTCGSGHFLLGAFARLLRAWEAKEPGTNPTALAQRALDQVAGVDLNPFAVAIARFRLLVAALNASGVTRLDRSPAFRFTLAAGDSLLHGAPRGQLNLGDGGTERYVRHAFAAEDLAAATRILAQRYAVVVGNPPYVTVKDKSLNVAYRHRYSTCHGKYALSVPFIERFWELATPDTGAGIAGWIGMINSNSFMKREFGKKFVEEFFPCWDFTHVIDTGGAYIPGHGTPTVLLFGRNRAPVGTTMRALLGLRGEPGTPADPAIGKVWSAIVAQVDLPGSESEYISSVDAQRAWFCKHPWSIGGGGAAELKEALETCGSSPLRQHVASIGIFSVSGEDEVYLSTPAVFRRSGAPYRRAATGGVIRDWVIDGSEAVLFPYEGATAEHVLPPDQCGAYAQVLWTHRSLLRNRVFFGKLPEEAGLRWHEIRFLAKERLSADVIIAYAEVATHNHFVLVNGGGCVFHHSAPVIELKPDVQQGTRDGLLGVLNSSAACFWLKQVSHNKGSTVDKAGARQRTAPFEDFYDFNVTKVATFPVPRDLPTEIGPRMAELAQAYRKSLPDMLESEWPVASHRLQAQRAEAMHVLGRMIALQEELDWQCYQLYGILEGDFLYEAHGRLTEPPIVGLGERAFEIALARSMVLGEEETTWFERHGSIPVVELPTHWPADYRALVERRIDAIEQNRNLALIERPEYKRRWNQESWEDLEKRALGSWLLARLETSAYWPDRRLQTTRDLAARAAIDPDFGAVAALWSGEAGIELEAVIRELVADESVPFLPVLRYTESGIGKRKVWTDTWTAQRDEDEVDTAVAAELVRRDGETVEAVARRLADAQKARRVAKVGAIPRPPKYVNKDFQSPAVWKLRGPLDVPKERFIRYPYAGREGDDTPLLGWGGWTYLQQVQALSAWYTDRVQADGWRGEQLIPLLAGIAELVPWVKQWHNKVDPEFGERLGDFYETWLTDELLAQGLTRSDLINWAPPKAARRGRGGQRSRATASE